jgi:hypothetical protein
MLREGGAVDRVAEASEVAHVPLCVTADAAGADQDGARTNEVEMMTTAVVVMEPGSDWPGQIGDSMNVLALSPGGRDDLRRTQETLAVLHRRKQGVHVAALTCGATADARVAGRRAQLAGVLLDTVAAGTDGQLILTASDSARNPARDELLALADTLIERLRGTNATVSLRFSGTS